MNQTLLRLEMIKMAISVGDFDVVHQLQLKIALLTHDKAIQEITEALHSKNYVFAQQLIDRYLKHPPKEPSFLSSFDDDESLKEAFELFEADDEEHKSTASSPPHSPSDLFDVLTAPSADDDDDIRVASQQDDAALFELDPAKQSHKRLNTTQQAEQTEQEKTIFDIPPIDEPIAHYEPIADIQQKYYLLAQRYPPLYSDEELSHESFRWIEKIATQGCTEHEVEEVLETMRRLKEKEEYAKAAELLLITANLPSHYAQYMLARELFRGEILEQNQPEAFSMIERLATEENYPEAICDLAQFYEYGIETKQNVKKAEQLYQQAMYLGIRRAEKHYIRLRKSNKGLLGFLRG